jgi:hypothetical protein
MKLKYENLKIVTKGEGGYFKGLGLQMSYLHVLCLYFIEETENK